MSSQDLPGALILLYQDDSACFTPLKGSADEIDSMTPEYMLYRESNACSIPFVEGWYAAELVRYYVQIAGVVGWLKVGQELVICRCQVVAEEGFEIFFFVCILPCSSFL